MSGQLWGTCPWCQRRKRVIKANGRLYAHDRPGGNFTCLGSHETPKVGSVRTYDKVVSLAKAAQADDTRAPWGKGKTNAEIVQELRDLINKGPAEDFIDTYTNPDIVTAEYPSAWGWDALYAFLWLGALAAGFAAGWWWRGR